MNSTPPKSTIAKPVDDLEFVNVSAYKFVQLDHLDDRRVTLLNLCEELGLMGTILLSHEGINLFVAGARQAIDSLLQFFDDRTEYQDLPVKESLSDHQPFSRMLVRIKNEIIAFGVEGIEPEKRTSPKLPATTLKSWLDEGRDITLLDVRNNYEVDLGTFNTAQAIDIDHFRQFPEAVEQLPADLKKKPLVMFCTGGIRCEKAGPFMERAGFDQVFQLDGGILRYFEECGGDHYDGECFVFDKRVALDPELNETPTQQCYACQHPLSVEDQQSDQYRPGECCPYCYIAPAERMRQRLARRQAVLDAVTTELPGSKPYDNVRPLNVPARYDHFLVIDFLCSYHPHVDRERWQSELSAGRILYQRQPVSADQTVRAGMRLDHLIPETIEPDVNADIRILFECDDLIAVDKPAPLPMHPCGRFNRNTLIYLVSEAFRGEKIRMVHRLDANTSGVVLLARKKTIAHQMHGQFEAGRVQKTYLARVQGSPDWETKRMDVPIGSQPQQAGVRLTDPDGLPATTELELVVRYTDGTALLKCQPLTGRTNQIRAHLWHLGLPIQGDPVYLPGQQIGNSQTLELGQPAMCLHAQQIQFRHPVTGDQIQISSSRPRWAQGDSVF